MVLYCPFHKLHVISRRFNHPRTIYHHMIQGLEILLFPCTMVSIGGLCVSRSGDLSFAESPSFNGFVFTYDLDYFSDFLAMVGGMSQLF